MAHNYNKKFFKCTLCPAVFSDMQECLRHELLYQHNQLLKRPLRNLRVKVKTVLEKYEMAEYKIVRNDLKKVLREWKPGQGVSSINNCYCFSDEKFRLISERVENSLKALLPEKTLKIQPFGSFACGLALRNSDLDFFINDERYNVINKTTTNQIYNKINGILRKSTEFGHVYAIRHARVPIINCKYYPAGVSVDINLCSANSIHNTYFLRDLLNFDVRLRELMIFLKIWAKQLLLVTRGSMNSYCLATMIIFYLQNPQPGKPALLPSIEKLQENIPEKLVMGVNYAYQIEGRIAPFPSDITTSTLIEGFFKFYHSFDFEKTLISPYLGVGIPLQKFKNGTFPFPAYHNQLSAIALINFENKQPFETEHTLCVQDAFTLNHNVARTFQDHNMYYFQKCVNYACEVYNNTNIVSESERYEALLFGIIERLAFEVGLNMNCIDKKAESHENLKNKMNFRSTDNEKFKDINTKMNLQAIYREDYKSINNKRRNGSIDSENYKCKSNKITHRSKIIDSSEDLNNKNLQLSISENPREANKKMHPNTYGSKSCKEMGNKTNYPSMDIQSSETYQNKANLQTIVVENTKELSNKTDNESADDESCKDMSYEINYPSLSAKSSEVTKNKKNFQTIVVETVNESCKDTDNKNYPSAGNETPKVSNKGMKYQLSEMVGCSNMRYQCIPSTLELRVISAYVNTNTSLSKNVNNLWVEYYMAAITEILTEVYCLDLQFAAHDNSDNHEGLNDTNRSHTFFISGTVDQWTGRLHQRYHDKSFMEFQLEQTKKFTEERRQNSQFAVQLNAILTINISYNKPAIDLILTPRNIKYGILTKKDPLRKFFMMFKCSMQTFNVKDKLNIKTY